MEPVVVEQGEVPVPSPARGPRGARRPREEAEGHQDEEEREHEGDARGGPPCPPGGRDGTDQQGVGDGNVLMDMFLNAEKNIKRRRCVGLFSRTERVVAAVGSVGVALALETDSWRLRPFCMFEGAERLGAPTLTTCDQTNQINQTPKTHPKHHQNPPKTKTALTTCLTSAA